jgi:hypothetical protein
MTTRRHPPNAAALPIKTFSDENGGFAHFKTAVFSPKIGMKILLLYCGFFYYRKAGLCIYI